MSAQRIVNNITDKRAAHKKRHILLRAVYLIAGIIALMPGLPLLVIFPEVGIPLTLLGLSLLALEFDWAGKTLLWFAKGVDRMIAWYRNLAKPIRYSIELFFLLLAIGITYLIFT